LKNGAFFSLPDICSPDVIWGILPHSF